METLYDKYGIPQDLVLNIRCKDVLHEHHFSHPLLTEKGVTIVLLSFAISDFL